MQKRAGLQSQATSPVNDSNVHAQATSNADNGESDCISSIAKENLPTNSTCSAHKEKSAIDCAEQSIRDQWKEIRIKKHNEILYLKSREKKEQESQEKISHQSSSDSKQKIQSNSSMKYNLKRSTVTG